MGAPSDDLPDFLSDAAHDDGTDQMQADRTHHGGVGGDAVRSADATAILARLQSDAIEMALAAVDEIAARPLPELQDAVAALLRDRFDALDRDAVERVLVCLDTIGDGRLVRPMEEALHAHGTRMSEHHAWRARRIVQRIRRFGRK